MSTISYAQILEYPTRHLVFEVTESECWEGTHLHDPGLEATIELSICHVSFTSIVYSWKSIRVKSLDEKVNSVGGRICYV